jgi:zinc transporter, ZIP family
MIDANVATMGAVAGFTIFLGLPIARARFGGARFRGLLNSITIGILFFLFVEVTEHGFSPSEDALLLAQQGTYSWGAVVLFFALFAGGVATGLLSLVWYEGRFIRSVAKPAEGAEKPAGDPGLTSHHLALMIAIGIGLHNFSEGLSIGASAAAGGLTLAATLAVGFGLHNATEGFGIASPLTGSKPSWKFLGALGLIGGGPTFVGTLLGALFTDPYVNVLFLSLASGAIIYVLRQLFMAGRATANDPKHAMIVMGGVVIGLAVGFGTELLLVAAGM